MLALERRARILSRLTGSGNVLVAELSREYQVTDETIRRDLELLEREGLARRTYGGAVRLGGAQAELPYQMRRQTNVESKRGMAGLIASRIPDGESVALDASTSALFVARALMARRHLSLITNSMEILTETAGKTDWTILATGGSLKSSALAFVGPQAERAIGEFHVSLAVMSCKGLDAQAGFTDTNEQDAAVKRAFMRCAARTAFLVDASKFGRRAFARIAPLSGAAWVVTDARPPEPWPGVLAEQGIELILPEV
ncbi:MAG: DeoR/GlpR family DNA-binding transcription regulator [Oscillospiraceae bacterium]|jgi:DeoR/GlpR family transcriptional regulator of sugar metabolism|nr:DeoR/GlpR family DNA-binding transcription regulator [Oscillospiraceae bacterium]